MPIFTDQMFNATANATSLTQLNKDITTSAGNYKVPISCRLFRIVICLAGQAATSLLEGLRVDLSCPIWQPNISRLAHAGGALRTAPAVPIPNMEYPFDQDCRPEIEINGQYLFNVTAVTPNIQIIGLFTTMPRNPISAHPGA